MAPPLSRRELSAGGASACALPACLPAVGAEIWLEVHGGGTFCHMRQDLFKGRDCGMIGIGKEDDKATDL